ncbi:aldehyde dehydrogenase family protein [Curvivirga sp.]|uniref:aldehyde dehydrogenase family protein n=1 Tax=Curvivirga sp. TaxID=2856848 RepID=UPI003B5B17C4
MDMYINGKWCAAENNATLDVFNPATEELIDTVPNATAGDVDKAVAAAKAAFHPWRKMTVMERSEMLREIGIKLDAKRADYAKLLTQEEGKPFDEHMNDELVVCLHIVDYYAQLIKNSIGRVLPTDQHETFNFVLKEPYGPTACIVPFNYPLLIMFWKVIPALAAGNTVIVRPSDKTPLATLQLAKDVMDHLPAGVLNIITGDVVSGQALATHPDVPTVCFTGSNKVGEEIVRSTAHQFKNLLMELGGKDAAVVTEDMDVKIAAKALATSALWNCGQVCTSTERIYVQKSIYEDFVAEITTNFEKVKIGNGLDEGIEVGPMVDRAAFTKVETHIQDAVAKGARMATGGKAHTGFDKGYYFEPTVLADVTSDMLCMTEETFGPTVAIMPYETIDDAIELVNSSRYGLGAVIMSMDMLKIKRFFEDVKAGTIWVNDPLPDNVGGPFGGMKDSGMGDFRELGEEGLEAFMETKHVHWSFDPKALQDGWFGEKIE